MVPTNNEFLMNEKLIRGIANRFLQFIARYSPGSRTLRVFFHRLRGVAVGKGVFIGTDTLIDTSHPHLVSIGNRVIIGIRCIIIAHFDNIDLDYAIKQKNTVSVRIEDDVFIGPGVIIMPNVKIGTGSVVMAGSVVTHSVPSHTMVQGNPAYPVARCEIPLGAKTPIWEFYRKLKKLH